MGCAHARPSSHASDAALAQTVLEIHRAKQAGAEYGRESAALCHRAELALAESRRLVKRSEHAQAQATAREGLSYASKARKLARLPARIWQASPDAVMTSQADLTLPN